VSPSERIAIVTHDAGNMWKLNEGACLDAPKDADPEDKYEPPCGWIIVATRRGAAVKFAEAPDDLEAGRGVSRPTTLTGNGLRHAEAARREAELKHWQEMIPVYSLLLEGGSGSSSDVAAASLGGSSDGSSPFSSLGGLRINVGIGFNVFRPKAISSQSFIPKMGIQPMPSTLAIRMVLDETTAVGGTLLYAKFNDAGVAGSLLGGFATYNYFSSKVYEGFWVQLGAGLTKTQLVGTLETLNYTAYQGLGTIGWRGGKTFNWGIGAGLNFLFAPKVSDGRGFMLFLPAVMLDVGWIF